MRRRASLIAFLLGALIAVYAFLRPAGVSQHGLPRPRAPSPGEVRPRASAPLAPSAEQPAAAPAPLPEAARCEFRCGHLSVHVVHEDGSPAAGVEVALTNTRLGKVESLGSSDAAGFIRRDLREDEYSVRPADGAFASDEYPVTVLAGAAAEAEIVLQAGNEVVIRVEDLRGNPLSDATVLVWSGQQAPSVSDTPVDDDGQLRRVLVPGAYHVLARSPGFASSGASFSLPGAGIVRVPLAAESATIDVLVRCEGGPCSDTLVSIVGRGWSRDNRPPDETGHVVESELAEGAATVVARTYGRERELWGHATAVLSASRTTTLTLDLVQLEANAAISGRVVDGRGEPVSGAQVRLFYAGGSGMASVQTGADGAFLLEGLRPLPCEIFATDGGRMARQAVQPSERVTLQLPDR